MTTSEFKAIYGRTYNSVVKEIDALVKIKENNYTVKTYLDTKNICVGHGDFVPSNKLVIKHKLIKGHSIEIDKRIKELENLIQPIREEKAKLAKIKRYEKEIIELEKELTYKKAWLEKNKG